ncbi:uncharacterized protein LOC119562373 [Drosophila subpulchrella]|uniref:uncharacterized protein LOC119562373 n=1 Tax=Drosophila subpulchrella TaxID=1486046 RepID=UPI0018A18743|nr:uncharacterized protein LOC119562373 [Drosophila subpulchrella]
MEQYAPRERSEVVEIYIQQNKSIVKTQRAFKKLKNVKSAPSKNTIKRLYEKFTTGEALSNPKRPNKSRPRRSDENIAAVRASVEMSPRTSQKRRSQQLGMARSTLQRIIRVDLKSKVYVNRPRTLEELKDNIREEIAAIPAEMLAKTMENAAKRAQYAINARGGHLKDIIFKN